MTITPAQLAIKVLDDLGVSLTLGATPSAARSAQVTDFYANVYQELEDMGLAAWEQSAIDERFVPALVEIMSGRGCGVKAWGANPIKEASGIRRLRVLTAQKPTGSVARGTYY